MKKKLIISVEMNDKAIISGMKSKGFSQDRIERSIEIIGILEHLKAQEQRRINNNLSMDFES